MLGPLARIVRKAAGYAGIALALGLLNPATAWAYIDPGAGSLAYQALLTAVLAIGIGLRRLFAAWRSRPASGDQSPSPTHDADPQQ